MTDSAEELFSAPGENEPKVRIIAGQVWGWDNEPRELSGQMWVPICVGCGDGPLMVGLHCEECTEKANWFYAFQGRQQ